MDMLRVIKRERERERERTADRKGGDEGRIRPPPRRKIR
jgi:hypothetical protein